MVRGPAGFSVMLRASHRTAKTLLQAHGVANTSLKVAKLTSDRDSMDRHSGARELFNRFDTRHLRKRIVQCCLDALINYPFVP
jgi:hypothetical protein